MGAAMLIYQTSTRGCLISLLNEHAQFDFRYCSLVADQTHSVCCGYSENIFMENWRKLSQNITKYSSLTDL